MRAVAWAFALAWLSPLVRAADKSASDYFVHQLPGAPAEPQIKMHAGHIEVTPEHNGNLFFWHFQNQHIANKQRTVIWLNGGPGCSSEDGALMEIGPYRVRGSDLVWNNGSWNEFANLLFVDNPVGTGFSFVNTDSYLKELQEMADQFIIFLEKWFTLFPQYEGDDIYFAGESYAGQHIPYIVKAALERNRRPEVQNKWNIKGLLIGNGWIAPKEQYDAYLKFTYQNGLIEKGSDNGKELQQQWRVCEALIAADPNRVDYPDCEAILSKILQRTSTLRPDGKYECYNMYDIRLKDESPSCGMNWPPDLADLKPYLRREDVIQALHVDKGKTTGWTECSGSVGSAFRARHSQPAVQFLPDIIKEVPILLFSGDQDLICNHLGTEAFIANMEWNGAKGFEIAPGNWAPRRDWTFEGEPAGFWQEARNLTYVLFYNASHMVPFDYGRRSRDMLDRFMEVDITSIGGEPTDSRIDGEKGPATSVGDSPQQVSDGEHQQAVDDAKWTAYRKSGEIVLVIVVVAAIAWSYYIWRERRKLQTYQSLGTNAGSSGSLGLERHRGGRGEGRGMMASFRNRRNGDVESGGLYEKGVEMDEDLHLRTPTDGDHDRYSIGEASSDGEASDSKAGPSSGAESSSR